MLINCFLFCRSPLSCFHKQPHSMMIINPLTPQLNIKLTQANYFHSRLCKSNGKLNIGTQVLSSYLSRNKTAMNQSLTSIKNEYLRLYNYIVEMDGNQIWKLRKIATGILPFTAFSEDEIQLLESKAHSKHLQQSAKLAAAL
jgi:hypothetical protein